ncbi:hypothetical protein DUNSADRAFT_2346 [Dunaliella salina]|uniref:Encoded protein n=1 Tax=Dunaliella salina TaxID=3046 RepID=A0ABQ7GW12_DUNSA|nr:hypothetical protein DUNSADRAFT_2346 [Dunaliella salina]|eukprot:KAF5838722.1 hypothetical protein DUNSADRAFT_2346 [Dunaliella salina]
MLRSLLSKLASCSEMSPQRQQLAEENSRMALCRGQGCDGNEALWEAFAHAGRCLLMLAGACSCWQVFAHAGRCLLMLAGACSCWQVLAHAGRCLLMLAGACSC